MVSGKVIYDDMPEVILYGSFNENMELEGYFYQSYPPDHES